MRKPDLSLIGQTYNDLRVDSLTDQHNNHGDRLYSCTCLLCGATRLATKQNIQKGAVKNCGNHHAYKDITDKVFGELTAKYPIHDKKLGKDRSMVWHCECSCGKTIDVSYHSLVSKNATSCGCVRIDKLKALYTDGTAPYKLMSGPRSTNSSGVTGVSFDKVRGKWVAILYFKRKKYFLGRHQNFDDAVKARQDAERHIHGPFLEWYAKAYPKQWEKLQKRNEKT